MNTVARMPSLGVGRLAKSMSGADSVMVAPFRDLCGPRLLALLRSPTLP
jgi:hypothetical protein